MFKNPKVSFKAFRKWFLEIFGANGVKEYNKLVLRVFHIIYFCQKILPHVTNPIRFQTFLVDFLEYLNIFLPESKSSSKIWPNRIEFEQREITLPTFTRLWCGQTLFLVIEERKPINRSQQRVFGINSNETRRAPFINQSEPTIQSSFFDEETYPEDEFADFPPPPDFLQTDKEFSPSTERKNSIAQIGVPSIGPNFLAEKLRTVFNAEYAKLSVTDVWKFWKLGGAQWKSWTKF